MISRRSRSDRSRSRSSMVVSSREPALSPGRGTFEVARANRIARLELGEALYQPKQKDRPSVPQYADAAPAPVSATPAKRPERDQRLDPVNSVNLTEEKRCKSRPNLRKGGKGTGRLFVPWCK